MIELSKGQEWTLATESGEPVTRLRLGLGWDQERNAGPAGAKRDVDLDASVVQFMGEQLFDLAFYNNLATRDGSVVHQGDNRSGSGDGDDEVIAVDLAKVYAKVETIVLLVSSYQGHTLDWIANAYCRIVDDATDTELARFTLTAGVPQTGLAMATIFRDGSGSGWRLRAIGEGIAVTVPAKSVGALRPYLRSTRQPDGRDVATLVGLDVAEATRLATEAGWHVRAHPLDAMLTMDFRPDRVNLAHDASGRVVSARVG
ncbi:TerD family protein [Nocardioides sp. W7]|uniref:TerD family protein n=1 Tax=Nocardioides sp. W7 TaxID=2931390 RepID=UPI001FD336FF|nr:TerD family protein [Nocardioides sp. W7]